MRITKIEQQVKDKNRYSIFIDGKFAFGLSELALINSGLRNNQELTKIELEKFKEDARTDKIYNQTLNLIARRPRSQWEIEDYLKRKGLTAEESVSILNMLKERGYINDLDFSTRWVESRRLLKQMSKRKLSLELRQKRISDEIIQQVLNEDEANEQEVLRELILKKSQQTRYKDRQKLIAYLARQGFNYDDIKQVISEISLQE